MLLKRNLTTILVCLLVPWAVQAQDVPAGNITVRSTPPGAEVTLKGDATVTGVTPTTFSQTLIGAYQVELCRYGYEKYTTHMTLDPSKQLALDITLVPKTRLKAAARSLFIPGWGQRYGDQKTKGFFFTVLAAGSVATYLILDNRFRDKFDEFEARRNAFDSARAAGGSYADLQTLQQSLASAQKTAYDAENVRRISIGAVVGLWAFNVLDALLFFPEERGTFTVKGVSVKPTAGNGTFGLALTRGF